MWLTPHPQQSSYRKRVTPTLAVLSAPPPSLCIQPPQRVDEFGALEVLPEEPTAQQRLNAVVEGLGLAKVGCLVCRCCCVCFSVCVCLCVSVYVRVRVCACVRAVRACACVPVSCDGGAACLNVGPCGMTATPD